MHSEWAQRKLQFRTLYRVFLLRVVDLRFSWLALAVVPVLLVIAACLLVYPWRPAVGHFAVMLGLGILLVELCLYTFPKIPFTCSYLPGKAQIHLVFWGGLMFFLRLLSKTAELEGRLLNRPFARLLMILALASAALGMHYLSKSRAASIENLLFEEEYPAGITTLRLS